MNAVLNILGDPPSPGLPVSLSSSSSGLLAISSAPKIPLRSPVKVVQGDALWLGEVIECHPDGLVVIQILHALNNISELTRLAARFTGSPVPKPEPEPTLS